MKKRSVLILILVLLLSTNMTAFANKSNIPSDIKGHWAEPYIMDLITKGIISGYPDGTFKPNNQLKNSEFLSLVLKSMNISVNQAQNGEAWEKPIINKALETGLIKSGEPMEVANNLITREQASLVIYRVLQLTEGLKEYFGQDNLLIEQMLTDYNKISAKYMPGVATVFRKGIMSGKTETPLPPDEYGSIYYTRLFSPQDNLTRAEMTVIISRLINPTTRLTSEDYYEKVIEKLWTGADYDTGKKRLKQSRAIVSYYLPERSDNVIYLPFEYGKPVVDEGEVVKELKRTPYNHKFFSFHDTLSFDEYINKEWALKDPIEYKTELANEQYIVSTKSIEKLFNVSYKDDLDKYEKELKYYYAAQEGTEQKFKDYIKYIKDNKLEIEGIVVTDKSLFYQDSRQFTNRVKMRLYLRYTTSIGEVVVDDRLFDGFGGLEDIVLKSNQWYQVDVEGSAGIFWSDQEMWKTGRYTYYSTWFLSDYIPVNPIQ